MRPKWEDRFIWCPLPVDSSLPLDRTSFIRLDDEMSSASGSETSDSESEMEEPWHPGSSRAMDGDVSRLNKETSPRARATSCLLESKELLGGSASATALAARKKFTDRVWREKENDNDDEEVDRTERSRRSQASSAKSRLTCRLNLNLDVEVQLKASIRGTLTLELFT